MEKCASNNELEKRSTSIDEEPERGYWTRQMDFMLSCIGYAVGLGNLWRFPYLCMRNGGGAFLIPYFTFLVLCGIPLFFMELVIGQFTSLSPLGIWNIAPLFKGLGYGMIIVSGLLCIYYNTIICWVIYYLIRSFTSRLPWGHCENQFNTETCLQLGSNSSNFSMANATHRTPAAEEFWHLEVLKISKGIDDINMVNWQLLLCLIGAWLITLACLYKGVKSSGKVVYVTAVAPYIFLTILLIRGVTLDGAWDGIKFYLTPDFTKLLEFQVWGEACLQMFYSLGPAWGGLITMASYNRFNNNCYRDAVIVPLVDGCTSLYGGFVIFSVIGYMAKLADKPIDQVLTQGPGLAFIAYPQAIATMPISPMWAIFFFIMLLTLGLDSQFGTFETVVSGFVDEWPQYLRPRKFLFTVSLVILEFLLGIVFVTDAGMYFFQITDWYCAAFSVMTIAFFECLVISWCYGVDRLYDEVEMMIGYKPSQWWKWCWCYITPTIMLIILGFSLATMSAPTYGSSYHYPPWAIGYGWCLASLSMLPLPLYAIYRFSITPGSFFHRLRVLTRPTPGWGPAIEKHRARYKYATEAPAWGGEKSAAATAMTSMAATPLDDGRNGRYGDAVSPPDGPAQTRLLKAGARD